MLLLGLLVLFVIPCVESYDDRYRFYNSEYAKHACGISAGESFNGKKSLGGEKINILSAPWMVSILYEEEQDFWVNLCTGTLITYNHVITAASCFIKSRLQNHFDEESNSWQVQFYQRQIDLRRLRFVAGDHCGAAGTGCKWNSTEAADWRDAESVYVKSSYLRSRKSDLAIFKLTDEFEMDYEHVGYVGPICVHSNDTLTMAGGELDLISFGPGVDSATPELNRIKSYAGRQVCRERLPGYKGHVKLSEDTFCTFSAKQLPCQGDIGAGLMAKDKSIVEMDGAYQRFSLFGVYSHSEAKCDEYTKKDGKLDTYNTLSNEKIYEYHTNVQANSEWICRKIGLCYVSTQYNCKAEFAICSVIPGTSGKETKIQLVHGNDEQTVQLLRNVGEEIKTLTCPGGDGWKLSVAGSDALCYRIVKLNGANYNHAEADHECEVGAKNGGLAAVRSDMEYNTTIWQIQELDEFNKSGTVFFVGGQFNEANEEYRWNVDRSLVSKDSTSWVDGKVSDYSTVVNNAAAFPKCLAMVLTDNNLLLKAVDCGWKGAQAAICSTLPVTHQRRINSHFRQ